MLFIPDLKILGYVPLSEESLTILWKAHNNLEGPSLDFMQSGAVR